MQFPDPLIPGRLVRRYKRFLADIECEDGRLVVAHCANPGSMMGLAAPGARVWMSPATNPKRKLKYTWELVDVDGGLVGVHTSHPNLIAAEAIAAGAVSELTGYPSQRREVPYGRNSRIDLLLEDAPGDPRPCYVEVKNVNLRRGGGPAEFPDAVTKRGTKHLRELADVVTEGGRAVMFYVVQRMDCDRFSIAGDIDPEYESTLDEVRKVGVEVICYDCAITTSGICLNRPLTLAL